MSEHNTKYTTHVNSFYARKQLLLSARLIIAIQSKTMHARTIKSFCCLKDSSFRNRKFEHKFEGGHFERQF